MRESLRLQHVDSHSPTVIDTQARAASGLIDSLEAYDEAVIRFGEVLLVKVVVSGRKRIIVENISPQLSRMLEENPLLIHDPHALIKHLQSNAPLMES